jgi:hypothetical protein
LEARKIDFNARAHRGGEHQFGDTAGTHGFDQGLYIGFEGGNVHIGFAYQDVHEGGFFLGAEGDFAGFEFFFAFLPDRR